MSFERPGVESAPEFRSYDAALDELTALSKSKVCYFGNAAVYNALIYGITGGVPHYINKLAVRDSVDEALLDNFFDRSAYLYEKPENIFTKMFPNTR